MIITPSFCQILFGKSKNDLTQPLTRTQIVVPDITNRRLDVSEMNRTLFGDKIGKGYLITLFILYVCLLVSFYTIFSNSMASNVTFGFTQICDIYESEGVFNDCRVSYWFFLGLCTAIMLVFILREINEQKVIQQMLTNLMLSNIIIVIILSILNIIWEVPINGDSISNEESPPLINLINIGTSIPIILFAALYHISLPSIVEFMGNKKSLNKIIFMVFVVSLVLYSAVGVFVPLGVPDVKGQYNISFRNYSAGYPLSEKPWWTYILSYFIVLYPALGVLAAFPMAAIPLSHNLISFFGLSTKQNSLKIYLIKILCVVLPAMVAFVEYDLVYFI